MYICGIVILPIPRFCFCGKVFAKPVLRRGGWEAGSMEENSPQLVLHFL